MTRCFGRVEGGTCSPDCDANSACEQVEKLSEQIAVDESLLKKTPNPQLAGQIGIRRKERAAARAYAQTKCLNKPRA